MSPICCSVGSAVSILIRPMVRMGQAKHSTPNNNVAQAQTSGRECARQSRKATTPNANITRVGVVSLPQVTQNPIVTTTLPTMALSLRGHISYKKKGSGVLFQEDGS